MNEAWPEMSHGDVGVWNRGRRGCVTRQLDEETIMGKERDRDEKRRARLGPGTGQPIRLQARNDAPSSGRSRVLRWLAGLAVAGSLFAVTFPVIDARASEAGLSSTESGRTNAATPVDREEEREDERDLPPPSEKMLQRKARWSAQDNAARTAQEHFRGLGDPGESDEAGARAEPLMVLPIETGAGDANARASKPELGLWLIGQLISIGNAERARAKIETFRERFPNREIPPQLMTRLEELESAD